MHSDRLDVGFTKLYLFDRALLPYFCQVHISLKGNITLAAAVLNMAAATIVSPASAATLSPAVLTMAAAAIFSPTPASAATLVLPNFE